MSSPYRGDARPSGSDQIGRLRRHLTRAIRHYNRQGADNVLDELLASFSIERVLSDGILPCVRMLHARRRTGSAGPSEERFADQLLEERLLALAQGWDHGSGPCAVLAPSPTRSDRLRMIAFGLVLRSHGWRIYDVEEHDGSRPGASRPGTGIELVALPNVPEDPQRMKAELAAFSEAPVAIVAEDPVAAALDVLNWRSVPER